MVELTPRGTVCPLEVTGVCPFQDLIVQRELQLVGEKREIHGWEKLGANHAIVEQPQQNIGIVNDIWEENRYSGSGRQEVTVIIGRRQRIGNILRQNIFVALAKKRQIDAITPMRAYLRHQFLGVKKLVGRNSG